MRGTEIFESTYENVEVPLREGTTIAILNHKISSKRKGERYFSGRWLENKEAAEEFWKGLVDYVNKYFETEIIEKEYPSINQVRREMIIGKQKKDN